MFSETSSPKTIGVLMLETRFPRLVGDIGNPDSFDCPVIYRVVKDAIPQRIVGDRPDEFLQPFIDAGHDLVALGADFITTSCGFLLYYQHELEAALSVPVRTSSLLLLPELEERYGAGCVGILTISASSLSPDILACAEITHPVPIGSTEGGQEFNRAILGNDEELNEDLCRLDVVSAAKALKGSNPELKAILLECTNMPPYKTSIEEAVGVSVYGWQDLIP